MKTATKTFGPNGEYRVDLEIDEDETQGWVSYRKSKYAPEFTGSLAGMEMSGQLTDTHFNEHDVPEHLIEQMTAWSESEGY